MAKDSPIEIAQYEIQIPTLMQTQTTKHIRIFFDTFMWSTLGIFNGRQQNNHK